MGQRGESTPVGVSTERLHPPAHVRMQLSAVWRTQRVARSCIALSISSTNHCVECAASHHLPPQRCVNQFQFPNQTKNEYWYVAINYYCILVRAECVALGSQPKYENGTFPTWISDSSPNQSKPRFVIPPFLSQIFKTDFYTKLNDLMGFSS